MFKGNTTAKKEQETECRSVIQQHVVLWQLPHGQYNTAANAQGHIILLQLMVCDPICCYKTWLMTF